MNAMLSEKVGFSDRTADGEEEGRKDLDVYKICWKIQHSNRAKQH